MSYDPRSHMIKLPGRKGGPPVDYLPVAERVRWFRDVHPNGEISIPTIVEISDTRAVMLVRVSIPDGGSATSIGSESKAAFPDYIEKANTVALGRALAVLGFGIGFTDEFEEGKAEADPKEFDVNKANTVKQTATNRLGRPAASGKSAPIPTDPEQAANWFIDAFARTESPQWSEEQHTKQAQNLALALKKLGLADEERLDLYEALTGKRTGKNMEPGQLIAINQNANLDLYQRIVDWWRLNREG